MNHAKVIPEWLAVQFEGFQKLLKLTFFDSQILKASHCCCWISDPLLSLKKKGGQNAHFLRISYLEIETIKKWSQLYNCLEHFSSTPADYTELLQLNV